MTILDRPTVLNSTVLSNFAYVDRLDLLTELERVVTVPAVREELEDGVFALIPASSA